MFEIIKKDLPNFPDEIIRDWIAPYYEKHGWPPQGNWNGVLFMEPYEFWQKVEWKKESLDLTKILYSEEWTEVFKDMYSGYMKKPEETFFGRTMGQNGVNRWLNAARHLLETGIFPKPICLLCKDGKYSVVDGNHRFVAWQFLLGINHELRNLPPEEKAEQLKGLARKFSDKWGSGTGEISELSKVQEVWVAYKKQ